jgi:hypothetical protein
VGLVHVDELKLSIPKETKVSTGNSPKFAFGGIAEEEAGWKTK